MVRDEVEKESRGQTNQIVWAMRRILDFFQEHWYKPLKGLFVLLKDNPISQNHLGTYCGDTVLGRFEIAMVLFLWKDISSLIRMISSFQIKLMNKLYF